MTPEEMAIKLQSIEDRSKSNTHRIEDVEKKLEDNEKMLASIARIDQKQEDMDKDLKEIKGDVKTMAGKSGKRWDSIIDKVLLTVIGAIVLYMLAKLGIA